MPKRPPWASMTPADAKRHRARCDGIAASLAAARENHLQEHQEIVEALRPFWDPEAHPNGLELSDGEVATRFADAAELIAKSDARANVLKIFDGTGFGLSIVQRAHTPADSEAGMPSSDLRPMGMQAGADILRRALDGESIERLTDRVSEWRRALPPPSDAPHEEHSEIGITTFVNNLLLTELSAWHQTTLLNLAESERVLRDMGPHDVEWISCFGTTDEKMMRDPEPSFAPHVQGVVSTWTQRAGFGDRAERHARNPAWMADFIAGLERHLKYYWTIPGATSVKSRIDRVLPFAIQECPAIVEYLRGEGVDPDKRTAALDSLRRPRGCRVLRRVAAELRGRVETQEAWGRAADQLQQELDAGLSWPRELRGETRGWLDDLNERGELDAEDRIVVAKVWNQSRFAEEADVRMAAKVAAIRWRSASAADLPPTPDQEHLSHADRKVILLLMRMGPLTGSKIRDELNMKKGTLDALLVNRGILRQRGLVENERGRGYRLTAKGSALAESLDDASHAMASKGAAST